MDDVQLRYGIPDIELACPKGGTINPAAFAGHQLIVAFLPTDENAALREINHYSRYANEFTDSDAWVLGIVQQEQPCATTMATGHGLASDPQGIAWRAFEQLLETDKSHERHERHERHEGAVYLFGRGGTLQKAWLGSGVADDIIRELHRQASW